MTDSRVDFADRIIAAIDKRVAEHDGDLTDEEHEYIAGLHDAQGIIRSHVDRFR